MCIVSNIGDAFEDYIGKKWPMIPTEPWVQPTTNPAEFFRIDQYVTKAELAELKKEIEQIRELLKQALAFDKKTEQPHCEKPDKLALFVMLAEALGVDISQLNLNKDGAPK